MNKDLLARKMDKLLLVCEAARANGWHIVPTGETVCYSENCCCPLGALAIAAGLADRYFESQLADLAIDILGVSKGWSYDFMLGFDEPICEDADIPRNLHAYNYGRAFRTLYATET